MNYSDWQKATMYVKRRCEQESKRTGRDIRYEEYSMYDGRKGYKIQLFCDGKLFKEWSTGIYNNYMDLKDACEVMIMRACFI